MIKRECRLSEAAKCFMGGGGGGGTDINQLPGGFRSWQKEQKDIRKGYGFQFGQYDTRNQNDPLLSRAFKQVEGYNDQRLPNMLAQYPKFGSELYGYQRQVAGLYGQLGNQAQTLGSWLNAPQGAAATIAGGGYSPFMGRMGSQSARIQDEQGGNLHGVGAAVREYQGREDVRQRNYAQALQQGQSILGQQQGLYQGQAGLSQMGAGLTNQRAGLLGQEQALQTGGLNQLMGTGNAAVGQFTGLTNPILGYLSGLFGGNQQAAIAQAQTNAQSNAAGDAKAGGTISSGIGAIGSIIGAVAL